MYLPKSKYTVRIVTPGQYTLNGEDYYGPILTTYKGEEYAGTEPGTVKGKVVKISPDAVKRVVPTKRIPTEEEYRKGSMIRYFRQDTRTLKVEELPTGSSETSSCYRYASASWILTGSLEDRDFQVKGFAKPVKLLGVESKNLATIDRVEKELPGISGSILVDPKEFYGGSVK